MEKNITKNKLKKHEKRYKIAIQARNFHYDNFSKWSTYFYVAIGAIFIGYCTILTADYQDDNKEHLKIGLLILGYICSILWYLSNKGYYFWALNFIKIIQYYENKIFDDKNSEKVYSILGYKDQDLDVIYPHRASNFSTSKISLVFSYLISFSWGLLFFYKLLTLLTKPSVCCTVVCCIFLNILVITILSIIGKYHLQSNIKDMYYLQNQNILNE